VAVIAGVATVLISVPLLLADGLDGLAAGVAITTVIGLAARVWYLSRLFPALQILVHSARAIAPTLPAAAAVLAVRAAVDAERTLGLALAELALFAAVAAAATYAAERPLLREVAAYVRGRAAEPASA
jgi:UDP-N-acetylmuramyl pentapeptide phosphotransferase/UDP-N-acetylglucosamine-1-phosphate transferase